MGGNSSIPYPGTIMAYNGGTMNGVTNGLSRTQSITADSIVDGDESNDIAICGFSIKFPQDARSAESFWKMMLEKRCAMTEFPADRLNLNGFHQDKSRVNTLTLRGGHFLQDDLSVFDADFFSISPAEAASMDPTQRWLLETAYRALENAGMSMESVSDTMTGVYTGSFSFDYMLQLTRDPECPPMHAAQGMGLSMLANRVSWFFNLRGPSIGLDSACSSAAVATDVACQALRNGSCDMAVVAGSNLATAPESYVWLNTSNFLSPDSRCHSFDHRANGYARGEGIAVMIIKRVSDAIRDGNTIRAVIRSTSSNEDGRTPGITQPSREAQERLIRETYRKAGLSMGPTRFFEAHGTGTRIGDPREAKAIGSAFREYRSDHDPLYVGAVKSNIGHLEGASGLAGLLKTVLVLEKGIILPNTNFEKINPKIDAQFSRLKFPEDSHSWPTTGLRRASVNSFGFGGANSHIVLDDAYNYLRLRSLKGKHCTVPCPPISVSGNGLDPSKNQITKSVVQTEGLGVPRLLVWSAADKDGIDRIIKAYKGWASNQAPNSDFHDEPEAFLSDLSFTLDSHRNHLAWRSFAILRSPAELADLQSHMSSPIRAQSRVPRLGFVFSGQGGQWFAMCRELLCYPSFKAELVRSGNYLQSLGSPWLAIDELLKTEGESNIDKADFGQPLSTILQVALVNLLRSFDIQPSAVVGHSSGEIAAAYAAGYLTCESAWKLAYFRGLLSAELARCHGSQPKGAMMSVGLPENRTRDLMSTLNESAIAFGISVACINSPNNVTVSGEESLIDQLKSQLDGQNVFARKLRVPLAYHSPQMEAILAKYVSLIGSISAPYDVDASVQVPMISSVIGDRVDASRLTDPSYWAQSTVSPVQFSRALLAMCAQSHAALVKKIDRSHIFAAVVDHLVEIGPHSTLQGPIRDTLRLSPRETPISYTSLLRRGRPATETMFQALGELYSLGLPLMLRAANYLGEEKVPRALLVNLPEYPFDHSQHYWHESRLSRNYRLRSHAPSELLGVRSRDWNDSDARWRNFMRLAEIPWAEQHVINGTILYPGTGMLAMAVEAAKQLVSDDHSRVIGGYTLRDIHFEGAIDLTPGSELPEVQTSLRQLESPSRDEPAFEFAIHTYTRSEWVLNCRGFISVEISWLIDDWAREKLMAQRRKTAEALLGLLASCRTPVPSQKMYSFLRSCGYGYGKSFQAAQNQHCNEKQKQATADVSLFSLSSESHVFHPVSMDAILHLCFTAFSSGGTVPMATSIPSHIRCIWISSEGLDWQSYRESVTACTTITELNSRGFACSGGALSTDDSRELRVWYEGLELTSVSNIPSWLSVPNPKQWYMNTDCKVALSMLTNQEVRSLLEHLHPAEQNMSELFRDLEFLIEISLDRLVRAVDPAVVVGQDSWKSSYWRWAQHHLSNRRSKGYCADAQSPIGTQQGFQELVNRLGNTNQVGRVYSLVASNLVAMFNGSIDPLELLVYSGLLKEYYQELAGYRCGRQVASYMDLLAHQKPGMRILEVGGGTGAATRNLVSTLCAGGSDVGLGSLRCDRYDFTDISLAFAEKAREEFAPFKSQMTFGVLDIEQDVVAQGFKEADYDVVVADNVLHATPNLAKTLCNLRRVLKPGGKLLMQEPLKPSGWILGFVFGIFPGWWLGTGQNRLLSPAISSDDWHAILTTTGFSGTDIVFKDFDDDVAHNVGWLVSTATNIKTHPLVDNPQLQPHKKYRAIIVIDESSIEQRLLSERLLPPLNYVCKETRVVNLKAVTGMGQRGADELVIFLADYGLPFLMSLDETSYAWLRTLVKSSRHILWVSGSGAWHASPDHGLLDGMARALRAEYYELHLVTLVLDSANSNCNKLPLLIQVAKEMTSWEARQAYEQEYLEIDGHLHTRRLIEARDLKSAMDSRLVPFEVISTPLDGESPFELSKSSSNPNAAPYFIRPDLPLLPQKSQDQDAVEIMVRAVSLQSRNNAAALGQEYNSSATSHYYCSGIVLRANTETQDALRPGDRVLAPCSGPLRSHIRLSAHYAVRMSDNLSFSDACATAPFLTAAYHALVEVASVRQSDSVLIRKGATPIGQAALQLLSDQGVTEVWTTASSKDDSSWILEHLGIGEDRVLPEPWFETQPMVLTQWEPKFDVVLSPDPGSSPPLLMNVMKSGGRYILLRAGNALHNNNQHIYSTPPSISVTTLHMGETHQGNPVASPQSIQYAVTRLGSLIMDKLGHHVKSFSISDILNFSRQLQKADKDTIVIEFNEWDAVDVRVMNEPVYSLNPDASYLIVGGLGGIGQYMARWLVSRGARYLILLSRSGPKKVGARQLLSELNESGVRVETPLCDVSDGLALKSVLASCTETMPPIKGCIQSSMVVTELIFEKMTFSDWKATIDPKVQGSWNLHRELPGGLDFFILVSSMMGTIGGGSLSAYSGANSYMDALARYRVSKGERAAALGLGIVPDGGYLIEHPERLAGVEGVEKYAFTSLREICALLEIYCDPANPFSRSLEGCQPVLGVRPPAHWRHLEEIPTTYFQPFWGHMHHIPALVLEGHSAEDVDGNAVSAHHKRALDAAERLAAAASLSEAAEIVSEALAQRMSMLLGTAEDRLDAYKPMHSYGIDSLSAIDIRTWVGQVFDVDIPVFEILGGATFASAGLSIARKVWSRN